jgi:hypothetical protein
VHPENEVQRVGAKARDLDNLGNPGGVETAQAGTGFDVIEGEHGDKLHCILERNLDRLIVEQARSALEAGQACHLQSAIVRIPTTYGM